MANRIVLAGCLTVLLGWGASARADEPKKSAPDPQKVCLDRLWKITDAVMDNHLDPPSRQEMFLGGVRALYTAAKLTPPVDLARQVSRLGTEEQFGAFLKDNWPNPKGEAAATPDQLLTAFTDGLLERVQGRPQRISASLARVLEASAANRYVGTGIQIGFNANAKLTQINNPFAGGPARKAGAKPGDLIVEVDGESMAGLTVMQVVDKIRGEEGTKVTFAVRQPDEKETRLLKMTRGPVPFQTVSGFQRTGEESWKYRPNADEPIAYLRMENMLPSTPSELRKLEKTLLDDGVRGLVLDLRSSGGGDVPTAALTADELLDGGLMFTVRDGKGHAKEYRADRDCLFRDLPVVVLVDGQTNGGLEYVAAALQDNGRVVVVGEATRGAGFVSTLFHLPDDLGALQLHTAHVERAARPKEPQEPSVSGWRPVTPNHVVALDRTKTTEILVWRNAQNLPEPAANAPPQDPQLDKALDVLRKAIKK